MVLLAAYAAATSLAFFQVQTATENGLKTIQLEAPAGRIVVYLPSDIRAGDTISGTVVAEPNGNTDAEKEKNLNVLEGVVVSTPAGNATPARPRFTWKVPPELALTPFDLSFGARDRIRIFDVLQPTAPAPYFFHFPTITQSGRPMVVAGPFDGNAANTDVSIGNQAIGAIAESPRNSITFCPPSTVGPTQAGVTEGEESAGATVRCVRINLTAPKTSLLRGESTTLKVEVSGLEGLREPLPILIENKTPSVVEIRGNTQIVVEPSGVPPSGICGYQLNLLGRGQGGFTIAAGIPAGNPPVLINATMPPGFVPMPGKPDGVQGDDTKLDDKTKTHPQGFNPNAKDEPQRRSEPDGPKWQHWDGPVKKIFDGFTAWWQKFYVISFVKDGKTYRGAEFRVHFKNTNAECDGGKWRQVVRTTVYVGDDENNLKKAAKVDDRWVPADPQSAGDGKWEIDTNDAGRAAKDPDYPHQDKGEMIDRPRRAKQASAAFTTNTPPRKKAKVVVEHVEFFTYFIKDGKICLMFKWGFKVKWVFKDGDDPTDPDSMNRAAVSCEFTEPTPCAPGSDDYKAGEAALAEGMSRFPK